MYHVLLAFQCINGCSDEGGNADGKDGVTFLEEGGDWRLPDMLYVDDLVLCGELEEDLRTMMRFFFFRCVEEEV